MAEPELKPKSTFIIPHIAPKKKSEFNNVNWRPKSKSYNFNYINMNNSNKKWEEILPMKVWTLIVKVISVSYFSGPDILWELNKCQWTE